MIVNLKNIRESFYKDLCNLYNPKETKQLFIITCDFCFGLSKTDLLVKSEIEVSKTIYHEYKEILNGLKEAVPIQYLINKADFFGLTFYVNHNVLIPRQETEELVALIIDDYKKNNKISILDIGTGSGIIPITLKQYLTNSKVTAIDISDEALKVAARNAERNKVEINFFELDILKPEDWNVLKPDLDLIVSNPPYVIESEKKLMHKNVLDYEPHLALFVPDQDPLLFYREIIKFAVKKLKQKGRLYFEINERFGNEVSGLMSENGFNKVKIKQDINGKDRIVYGVKE